jgi:hypothetical protein
MEPVAALSCRVHLSHKSLAGAKKLSIEPNPARAGASATVRPRLIVCRREAMNSAAALDGMMQHMYALLRRSRYSQPR